MTSEQIKANVAALANRWPWMASDHEAAEVWREDIRSLAAGLEPEWDVWFARAVQALIADPQQYGRPDYRRIEARMESLSGKQLRRVTFKADPNIGPADRAVAADSLRRWRQERFGGER